MRIGNWIVALVLLCGAAPAAAQHAHGDARAQANTYDAELARELLEVRLATERYRDHAAAVAAGFRLFGAEGPLMGEHWYHPERVKQPLDLTHPSTLQYAWIDGRRQLVGVAYTVYRRADEPLPEGFAGTADAWHVHDVARIGRTLAEGRPFLSWLVERGIQRGRVGAGAGRTDLTMLHAWVWLENPDGLFAQQHRALPYLRAGLPASYADHAGEAAALGVGLASSDMCEWELRRLRALARLDPEQHAAIAAACREAESIARASLRPDIDAATLNAHAAHLWNAFVLARDGLLTAEQRLRLDAVVEHPTQPR